MHFINPKSIYKIQMQATNRDVFSIREKKPMIFIYVRADLQSDRIEYQHLQCEKTRGQSKQSESN